MWISYANVSIWSFLLPSPTSLLYRSKAGMIFFLISRDCFIVSSYILDNLLNFLVLQVDPYQDFMHFFVVSHVVLLGGWHLRRIRWIIPCDIGIFSMKGRIRHLWVCQMYVLYRLNYHISGRKLILPIQFCERCICGIFLGICWYSWRLICTCFLQGNCWRVSIVTSSNVVAFNVSSFFIS